MSNNINNIATSVRNIIGAATGTVAVATKLLADGTALTAAAIAATPDAGKALVQAPLAAYEGVLTQGEDGMSEADAHTQAFKYVNQPLATTITQVARGAGSLAAEMWSDVDTTESNTNDDNANK
jgi:hypothetical protein